jgi:hypothetical protein
MQTAVSIMAVALSAVVVSRHCRTALMPVARR